MLSATKIIGGVLFAGATSGAIASGVYFFNKEISYLDLLNSETPSKRLIVDSDKNTTTTAWTKYKEDNKDKGDQKDAWKLKNWNSKKGDNNTLESLIKECEKRSKEGKAKNKEDKDYKQFLSWCSVAK